MVSLGRHMLEIDSLQKEKKRKKKSDKKMNKNEKQMVKKRSTTEEEVFEHPRLIGVRSSISISAINHFSW